MVGCKRERVKNPGVLKIHLYFLGGNPPTCFIFYLEKNELQGLYIYSILKSLIAEIIEVPISLHYSLTSNGIFIKRGCYLVCAAVIFDIFTKRWLFNVKRKEQWLCVAASRVRMEYFIAGLALKSAVKWLYECYFLEAHRTENCMSWGHDPK